MVVGEFIRDSLLKLEVDDTVNLPLHMKSTISKQAAEMNMFDDSKPEFKTVVDKARNEVEVKRVK